MDYMLLCDGKPVQDGNGGVMILGAPNKLELVPITDKDARPFNSEIHVRAGEARIFITGKKAIRINPVRNKSREEMRQEAEAN
jgi:hypothetical protein